MKWGKRAMTIPESGISRPRGHVNTIEVKLQEFEQLLRR